jgi:hypothetical protein
LTVAGGEPLGSRGSGMAAARELAVVIVVSILSSRWLGFWYACTYESYLPMALGTYQFSMYSK